MRPLPSLSMSSPGIVVRVDPDVPGEVRVAVGDAAVDHPDDHGAAPRRRRPGLRRVDVGVRELVQAPELPVARVVGRDLRVAADVVRLGEDDVRIAGERRRGGADRGALREPDERQPGAVEHLDDLRAPEGVAPGCGRDPGPELDNELALDELGVRAPRLQRAVRHTLLRTGPRPHQEQSSENDGTDDPSPHRGRDSEPLVGKKKGAAQSSTRPMRTQPLWPPSPIAFESATRTCASRASFGT